MKYRGRKICPINLYPAVYWPDHPHAMSNGMVYVHRAEVFDTYGEIPDDHHVHHTDGNKWNWSSENLELLSAADHIRLHMAERRPVTFVYERCATCGADIKAVESRRVKVQRMFCNTTCMGEFNRKIKWPPIASITDMIFEYGFEGAGRSLGVSGNAIRRHLRKNGLEPKNIPSRFRSVN